MSNKRGGVSWNNSVNSKTGMKSKTKCKHCGRQYKHEQSLEAHENNHKYCGD
jgi:hypothetical protein